LVIQVHCVCITRVHHVTCHVKTFDAAWNVSVLVMKKSHIHHCWVSVCSLGPSWKTSKAEADARQDALRERFAINSYLQRTMDTLFAVHVIKRSQISVDGKAFTANRLVCIGLISSISLLYADVVCVATGWLCWVSLPSLYNVHTPWAIKNVPLDFVYIGVGQWWANHIVIWSKSWLNHLWWFYFTILWSDLIWKHVIYFGFDLRSVWFDLWF